MDLKAIPSRRSNRNIGRTTGAEAKYKPGRCVRNGLTRPSGTRAPVGRNVLTLRGGGLRNAVGCAWACLRSGRATSAAHKDETRRTGNPRPPAAIYASTPRGWGGVIAPQLFQLAGRNPSRRTRRGGRCGEVCGQAGYVVSHRCHLAPRPGQSTHRRERRRARAEGGTDTLPSTRRASLLQRERTMK